MGVKNMNITCFPKFLWDDLVHCHFNFSFVYKNVLSGYRNKLTASSLNEDKKRRSITQCILRHPEKCIDVQTSRASQVPKVKGPEPQFCPTCHKIQFSLTSPVTIFLGGISKVEESQPRSHGPSSFDLCLATPLTNIDKNYYYCQHQVVFLWK